MATSMQGRCLCGDVALTLEVDERHAEGSHCRMCLRWGGGPLFVAHGTRLTFDNEAAVTRYRSSDWAERGFCKRCGTHLFYRLLDADYQAVPVGVLEDDGDWVLTQQIHIDAKPNYYSLAEETPRLTGAEIEAQHTGNT